MKSLAEQIPPAGEMITADEALVRFLGWTGELGLELYPAQDEALLELCDGRHVVLATPTGSGKSLVATFLHYLALCRGERSFYTCPVKALVNEKFFALCNALGAERVGLLTGDGAVNRDAPVICCTAEVLANLALREPLLRAEQVVMDEFHYYGDRDRGTAWQVPLLLLEQTRFLLMSATLGDTANIEKSLREVTGRGTARVSSAQRPVPLDFYYSETPLHETLEKLVTGGRAPVYLVNFSQRSAAERAQDLMSQDFSSKEEKEKLKETLQHQRFDTPFGKELQKLLRHGIGLHHAGLLPKYRLLVEQLAQQGLLKVISGTDTLGVGVNVPIRTVALTQLCKFDGEKTGLLTVRDFLQIAGRAGRKGFDTQGTVVAQAPEHVIENLKLKQREAAGKKKIVLQKPPQKGYVHWDNATFVRLMTTAPAPLESRFAVSFGMILNLLQAEAATDARQSGGKALGYRRLVLMIQRSHDERRRKALLKSAAAQLRTLRAAGLIELVRGNEWRSPHLKVADHLQRDFSLNQTLSLWLIDTLPRLPELPEAPETHALQILSLVESVLEDPQSVIWAQLDRAKGEKIAELKAQGMDYDDRMKELEKVEHPKPMREFVYDTFNAFAAKHPWVGAADVKPKSIAREMLEKGESFNDYVRDYSLQRAEGALLRYLSDAYKTLVQNVPEPQWTDALLDVRAQLRLTLRGVDSSLLDEWERLRAGGAALPAPPEPGAVAAAVQPTASEADLARIAVEELRRDPRKLASRVRAELHRLLFALARREFEVAAAMLRTPEGAEPWTAQRLEQELQPVFAALGAIDVTPRARRPDQTALQQTGPKGWTVQQRLLAPMRAARAHEDLESPGDTPEHEFALSGTIDLDDLRVEDTPLFALVGVTA